MCLSLFTNYFFFCYYYTCFVVAVVVVVVVNCVFIVKLYDGSGIFVFLFHKSLGT